MELEHNAEVLQVTQKERMQRIMIINTSAV